MTSQPMKHVGDTAMLLRHESRGKSCEDKSTDYTKCIICQGHSVKYLHFITPITKQKFIKAIDARQDEVFQRLLNDSATEKWLEDSAPKWHPKCRNWYINKKSYQYAEKKRSADMSARASHLAVYSEKQRLNLNAVAFTRFMEELEAPLFHDLSGSLLKSVRNRYREILRELGVKNADEYRTISMKLKLQQHFGSRVSVLYQICGSGFKCATGVTLGDALEKLRRLEADHMQDEKHFALRQAAKIH